MVENSANFYMILSIVGFFGIIALSINAFFIRGLWGSINTVAVQTAILLERSMNTDNRLTILEKKMSQLDLKQ